MLYKFLTYTLLTPLLWGLEIYATNTKTFFIKQGKLNYSIEAKEYVNRYKKGDLSAFLANQKLFRLKNLYYKDGSFKVKNRVFYFNKAFKWSKKVYLYNVKSVDRFLKIDAKEAVYFNNKILLKDCEIRMPKRVLRRKKYILNLDN